MASREPLHRIMGTEMIALSTAHGWDAEQISIFGKFIKEQTRHGYEGACIPDDEMYDLIKDVRDTI